MPATARVYRITMDGVITSVFEPSRKLLVINGVTQPKKKKTLLATDFFHGSLVEVDAKKGTKTIIATGLRGADGLDRASAAPSTSPASISARSGRWTPAART